MDKDAFEARRVAFEEEYFRKQDAQLVAKLKAVFRQKTDREALREATAITDDQVLDTLSALNLSGEMLSGFKLLPLIEVAWADGHIDAREARAVLTAAEQRGLAPGSAAHSMLENALKSRPGSDLRKAWYLYAEQLRKVLNPQELAVFRNDLLEMTKSVASASGGLLNVAFTVSANEKRVLESVERALTHEPS